MLSKPYCHKWHNALMKTITEASSVNTALQVIRHMNNGMSVVGA